MEPPPPVDGYAGNLELGSGRRDAARDARGAGGHMYCSVHQGVCGQYAPMITMAIMDSPDWCLTRSEIYSYMTRHFPSDWLRGNWQNYVSDVLSISPLYVKMEREAVGECWSVVPRLLKQLQEAAGNAGRYCCRWQMVTELHGPIYQRAGPRVWDTAAVSKNSTATQKSNNQPPLSSPVDSSIPLPNGWRKPQCPNSSGPHVGGTTDPGDQSDPSPEAFPNQKNNNQPLSHCELLLKRLIVKAILLSPYMRADLLDVYRYCQNISPQKPWWECLAAIKLLLDREACFRRLPPDYWTLDLYNKDVLEANSFQLSGDLVNGTSRTLWVHDHGSYP